jgi:hypothetical protein
MDAFIYYCEKVHFMKCSKKLIFIYLHVGCISMVYFDVGDLWVAKKFTFLTYKRCIVKIMSKKDQLTLVTRAGS